MCIYLVANAYFQTLLLLASVSSSQSSENVMLFPQQSILLLYLVLYRNRMTDP